LRYKVASDQQIHDGYRSFALGQMVDYDKADELRNIIGEQWKTLVPSTWRSGNREYRPEYFLNNVDNIKALLEDISSLNYEIAIREMSLPHIQKLWATYLSSFATLYINSHEDQKPLMSRVSPLTITNPANFVPIEGHGKPYGTSYAGLEAQQKPIDKNTSMIPLGGGLFMKFHDKIPVVTDELKADGQIFYAQRPVIYFASNAATEVVDSWVMDDGLVNFALVPMNQVFSVPAVRFTPQYAFLNKQLYLNMDVYFSPASPTETRENYDINVVSSPWPYDRHQFFLEYRHFGKYGSGVNPAESDQPLVIADVVKKVEQAIDQSNKDLTESTNQVKANIDSSAQAVKQEVAAANSKNKGENLSAASSPPIEL
jgi:hypothetical protein